MSRNLLFIVFLWGLPQNNAVPSKENESMEEKCERVGGPGTYERVQKATTDAETCVKSLTNISELQQKIEAAKPIGDLDTVFQKYCRKAPIFTDCVNNFTATFDPCLEVGEKENKKIVSNITESLLRFLCFKEGDRIALFVAEGGPECLQSKQEEIHHCGNTTMTRYQHVSGRLNSTLAEVLHLGFQHEECQFIQQFQECVITTLKQCAEPTPANMVESLFQYIVKMTPCQNMKVHSSQLSDRSSAVPTIWQQSEIFITTILLFTRFIT